MTVQTTPRAHEIGRVPPPPSSWFRRTPPIIWWAALGAVFVAIQLAVYGRWILAGDVGRTPRSGDVPGFMRVAAIVHDIAGPVLLVGVLWFFVLRPRRREGRLTTDGLLCLACLTTLFWQDLLSNYFRHWVVYNTEVFNLGAWYKHVPGFETAGGSHSEPILFMWPMYAVAFFGATVIAGVVMRRARRRHPEVSRLRLFGLFCLTMGLFDLVLEIFWVRLGLFVYPGTIDGLTLFSGHYYQFPVYESVIWGVGWAAVAALRYFRNDRGETLVERGMERLQTTPVRTAAIRFLAFAAAANLILLGYNVAAGIIAPHTGNWPKDFVERPYYQSGFCTPETTYACHR